MKLTASKEGTTRYFLAKLGWKEQFDPKEIEMLSAGAVPMLIPPSAVQGRKNNVIQYDISPYSTLEFYLSCILSREQFAQLMLQCISLFRQMQRVYLSYKKLVLEMEQIYVRLSDRTLHFIYLPLANSRREASIPAFFRTMIHKASRSTYEQVSFLDSCLAWLDRPAPFVMDAFEDFIQGGCTQASAAEPASQPAACVSAPRPAASAAAPQSRPVPPPVPGSGPAAEPAPQRIYQPVFWEDRVIQTAEPPVETGGTSRLDTPDGGGTVVLAGSRTAAPRFFLVREKTNERVEISRSPFLVGVEAGSVDYCITDNPAVSRKHARFFIENGQCTIADQKSTNRTYVNDCALEPQTPQLLQNGDRIRLANENFTFVREG